MPKRQSRKTKQPKNRSNKDESDGSDMELPSDMEGDDGDMHGGGPPVDEMEAEQREIRRLEKLLGLNKKWKRKKGKKNSEDDSGANKLKLPASFKDMGLDYLLKPILKSEFEAQRQSKDEDEAEVSSKKKRSAEGNTQKGKQSKTEKSTEAKKKQSLYTEDAESGGSDNATETSESETEEPSSRPSKYSKIVTDSDQRLIRRSMAVMNRLSEPTVPPLFNETCKLYSSGQFPRAAISNSLCDAAMLTCVTKPTFVVPDKVSSPVAMLFAFLRNLNIAPDAVGQLIHRLTWLLVEYRDADEQKSCDLRETPRLENSIRLLSHLLIFRCIDPVLLLDILKMFGSQIGQFESGDAFDAEKAEFAANLAISLLRSAGLALRKNDPSGLSSGMKFVQDAAANARSHTAESSGSRLHFLAEVIAAVRNNNFGKIPGYDSEESTKFARLYTRLKQELSTHDSANESPFRVSLSALASFGESGSNWWLKADTCSGPMALEVSGQAGKSKKEHSEDKKSGKRAVEDGPHAELAKKLHLNTDVRRSIFSVIISSSDIDDAIERLLKLPLRTEAQRTEAIPVAFECCVREKNYNPFYSQLMARLCTQEADRKQRLFRLAVKKSFSERLAMPTASPTVATNTAKLCVDLMRLNAISFVTALRCIDFASAAPGSPTYAFLHLLLDTFFHSSLDESSFKRIVVEPLLTVKAQVGNGRRLGSALLIFAKHMYDSGQPVMVDDDGGDDDEGQKRKKVKGSGKYKLDDLRPRLDLLSSELL